MRDRGGRQEVGAGGEGRSQSSYPLQPTTYNLLPAFLSQAWYLTADIACWTGLMPHIHRVDVLERRGGRTLARIDARWGWVPITFVCGFAHDEERHVMHRWYLGPLWHGIVETWRVREGGDGLVEISVAIRATGPRARLLAMLVVAPLARRQLEMIDLLAVAHRRSHQADGWD